MSIRCERIMRIMRGVVCVCVCGLAVLTNRCSKSTYIGCRSNRHRTAPATESSCLTETRRHLCPNLYADTSHRCSPFLLVLRPSSSDSSPTTVELTQALCSVTRWSKMNQIKTPSKTSLGVDSEQVSKVPIFISYYNYCL